MPPSDLTFPLRRSADMIREDPVAAREAFHEVAASSAPECPSCKRRIRHRKGVEWCQDMEMSEKVLQDRVRDRAKRRGWDIKHVGKGIAAFDATGKPIFVSTAESFPDLFMLHAGQRRALAIELKRENGVFQPGQLEYLQLLNRCGIPAVVVRPSDLREGRVNAILESA